MPVLTPNDEKGYYLLPSFDLSAQAEGERFPGDEAKDVSGNQHKGTKQIMAFGALRAIKNSDSPLH